MSNDLTATLEARKKAIQDEFDALNARKEQVAKQRALCDQALQAVRDRQISLQGEMKVVQDLLTPPAKDPGTEPAATQPIPVETDETPAEGEHTTEAEELLKEPDEATDPAPEEEAEPQA